MSYQGFLISNYATGFDRERQPWLLPDDAMETLYDGYIYRGVLHKREGYNGFATGLKSGIYCESRMVHRIASEIKGLGNNTAGPYNFPVNNTPIKRGGFSVVAGGQLAVDNGLGSIVQTIPAINILNATQANPCQITTTAPHGYLTGDQIIIRNVTGMTELNSFTPYTITVLNAFNFSLDGVDSTNFSPYVAGGVTQKVIGNINYTSGAVSYTFAAIVNNVTAIIYSYDYHPGNPVMGIMNFYSSTNDLELIVADTQYVNKYDRNNDVLFDISQAVAYNGDNHNFWSWTNYANAAGAPRLIFANGSNGDVIQSYNGTTVSNYTYALAGVATLNCTQLFQFKNRLILFQTIENGALFPRRIRISGFGANCDVFNSTAPGAGVIDIPDNSWFFGAAFNRDDLLFFSETSTWSLKYTGNDATPFVLEKIDESRGSKAAFSVITYLNRTMAASPRGLIMSDGYRVERMDNNIPDYSYNEIDGANFRVCFSGFVDEDRDVYLIHPSPNQDRSDRILTINFEEDNYAVYRLPLSCMGNYINKFDITWNDLSRFNNWDELAAEYGNWNSFSYSEGAPIALGGGHGGEIWKLVVTEIEDNPQAVRGITIVDGQTLQVETDYNNYQVGDYIAFEGLGGMTQLNSKQAAITSIITPNRVFNIDIPTLGFSAYTSGGFASRVIPFEAVTKKFNPFAEADKKVRCGWLYFYVTTSDTTLTDINDNPVPCLLDIQVITNDSDTTTTPIYSYKVDCSNLSTEIGSKKWFKLWINQTARFVQFKISNVQAGAKIEIHAMMPGFQPVGRLI